MLRFSLRELLLGTTLVAASAAWMIDSSAEASTLRVTRNYAEQLRKELACAKGVCQAYKHPEQVTCWQFDHPEVGTGGAADSVGVNVICDSASAR